MAAPLGTQRARLRIRLTGETHAQARRDLAGPDGVPDAEHPAQASLEAAILSELHDAFSGDHHPLNGDVYGMARVRPSRGSLVLHPAGGRWQEVLDLLLPESSTAADLGVEGLSIAGIPGLRCRALPKGRIVLYRPDTPASVLLQVPADDTAQARQWIIGLGQDGDPMRTAATWTAAEREQLPVYEAWLGDVTARSRVLRRLLAFRDLPAVSLIDDEGQTLSPEDFRLLLAAGAPAGPVTAPRTGPVRGLPLSDRPLVLAVVGGHAIDGQGRGGVGRTRVAAGLARALSARGLRVLLIDADPQGHLRRMFALGLPKEVRVESAVTGGELDLARLRQLARDPLHDIAILDSSPYDQRTVAEAADRWIGVASLWNAPDPWEMLVDEVTGANGRRLPAGWDERWLSVMRANQWAVRWRLAPGDFEGMFLPFRATQCAGIVLLGEREQPGARARDYLAGLSTALPVLVPAVPYIADVWSEGLQSENAAFERVAESLLS